MNVQRMKFAWARGARFQVTYPDWGFWKTVEEPPFDKPGYPECDQRIHPDDAHLEYGPLSSALRETVITGKWANSVEEDAAMTIVRAVMPQHFFAISETDGVELRFFLLFLAEYMADKGL